MRDPEHYLSQFFGLWDLMSQRHGWPKRSDWWTETLADAERSGVVQRVIRKPRRIGASSLVLPLTAVCEAYYGEHEIPPNDVGYFLLFSVKTNEAAKRLRGIAAVLDAIGRKYRQTADTIELADRPIAFKVQPASFRTAVGDTSIGIWCDEVSRWLDVESGANPATEVLRSVRPTLATMPNAKLWLVSSPLSNVDAHAAAFDLGNTSGQRVYHCAGTWIANPTITEEQTHDLEPHEPTWLREWCGQPSDGVTGHWFGERALELSADASPPERISRSITYTIAADPAFASDRFGWAVVSTQVGDWDATACARDMSRVTRVHECGAWKPDRSPREMARRLLNEVCRRYHVTRVFSDQYHGESWRELAKDVGLTVVVEPWTGGDQEGSKSDRYKKTRMAMLQNAFRMPSDPDLLREFRSVRGTLLPSGGERIEVPRSAQGHGDRVAAIVLAASKALERPPQLAPAKMTFAEYAERSWLIHHGGWGALPSDAFMIEDGQVLSFSEIRRRVACGLI